MSNIDLGDNPTGQVPDAAQKSQIRTALEVLPLAGGTMQPSATIGWNNVSAIREAGEQGLELECSVGYKWQWVAGRMIMRNQHSGIILRVIATDTNAPPDQNTDQNLGFGGGAIWETSDGAVYKCDDPTTGAAVWSRVETQIMDDLIGGNNWRFGFPIINGMADHPNDEAYPIYEQPIQVSVYDAAIDDMQYFTFLYADTYNGYPSYTQSGNVINFDPINPPSPTPQYSSLFFYAVNDGSFRLNFYNSAGDQFTYTNGATNNLYEASLDPSGWNVVSSSYVMQSIALTTDPLIPLESGRLYRPPVPVTGQPNLFISSNEGNTSGAGDFMWVELVVPSGHVGAPVIDLMNAATGTMNPSAILGTVPFAKGGTNSSSQQAAVQNLSSWVTSVVSSSGLNANNAGTTVVVNSSGNVALTVSANLNANTSFKVIRQGTGEVSIFAASGVTLLGAFVSGTPSKSGISARYDLVNITQVSANIYVLSGNFKASAF